MLADANGNQHVYTYYGYATKVETNQKQADGTYSRIQSWSQSIGSLNRDTGATDANNKSEVVDYTGGNSPYQITSVTNRNDQQSALSYDAGTPGALSNIKTVSVPSNGGTLVTTYTYRYDLFDQGWLTEVQEGAKTSTRFDYYNGEVVNGIVQARGLLKSVQTPKPGATGARVTTTYTYTEIGNVQTITVPAPDTTGRTVTYTYEYQNDPYPADPYSKSEALGEPVTVTVPLSSNPAVNAVTHYRYDGRGNITAVIDPAGVRTDYFYNVADQLAQVVYPPTAPAGGRANTVYTYLYPGGPMESAALYSEAGFDTNDPYRRGTVLFRQVLRSAGNEDELKSVSGSVPRVDYGLDGLYRPKQIKDGNSHATSYEYDLIGNLKKQTYPNYNTTATPYANPNFDGLKADYDNDGNIIRRTDGMNRRTTYQLATDDSRLQTTVYPAGTLPDVQYHYDEYDRVIEVADGTADIVYAYDDLDNITSVTTTYKNQRGTGSLPPLVVSYSFNNDGSRASMTTPAGTISYSYDDAGRMTVVSFPWGQTVTYDYYQNGWLHHQRQDKIVSTYTYNGRGFLTDLTHTTPGGDLLSEFGSTTDPTRAMLYDAAGNRTKMLITMPDWAFFANPGGEVFYAYDNLSGRDRLKEETGYGNVDEQGYFWRQYDYTYDYDFADNLTTLRSVPKSYNNDNQFLFNAYDYSDGNGNPSGAYVYDDLYDT
jgi:YD repeat-containing protein